MWLTQRIRIFYWLNDEAKFWFVELNSISWIHLKCLQYARAFHCVLFIIFKKLMKNAFSARENPFTDFSLAFAKCFCSLAWLFQCKQTNLTGIRKCIKICSSGIYHLLVSMFRTHTHTQREGNTHTLVCRIYGLLQLLRRFFNDWSSWSSSPLAAFWNILFLWHFWQFISPAICQSVSPWVCHIVNLAFSRLLVCTACGAQIALMFGNASNKFGQAVCW